MDEREPNGNYKLKERATGVAVAVFFKPWRDLDRREMYLSLDSEKPMVGGDTFSCGWECGHSVGSLDRMTSDQGGGISRFCTIHGKSHQVCEGL